jgi:hypothetical protein
MFERAVELRELVLLSTVAIRPILELSAKSALIHFYLERFPQSRCESQHGFRFERLRAMSRLFNLLQFFQCESIPINPVHRSESFCQE